MAEQVTVELPKIDSCKFMKKQLKDQFFPHNETWIARDRLKTLRQTESIRYYGNEFSSLIRDINNMLEEDKLHNFHYGLQKWEHNELRRMNIKDLPSAKLQQQMHWHIFIQDEMMQKVLMFLLSLK